MMLQHPELMIEFLLPERGRGGAGVRKVPALGINAQPLRFMDVALMMTLHLSFGDVPVTVPHPAAFALHKHKLLVVPRRHNPDKKLKDLDAALMVLDLLERKGEMPLVRNLMARFPLPWHRKIIAALTANHQAGVASKLGA